MRRRTIRRSRFDTAYEYRSRWLIAAPLADVWAALTDVEA